MAMARIELERYRLEKAAAYLDDGLRIARPGELYDLLRAGRYVQAHLAATRGNRGGALEILRDFPDLSAEDQQRFVATALNECARLEEGVQHLGSTVYSAGEKAQQHEPSDLSTEEYGQYASRIRVLDEYEAIEVDFSNFEFSSSKLVNDFYDVLDKLIEGSGRNWYIIVNYKGVSIWPEAWVAFAHRGKKVNVNYSLGTVRYVERDPGDAEAPDRPYDYDPDMFDSRDKALEHIQELRQSR